MPGFLLHIYDVLVAGKIVAAARMSLNMKTSPVTLFYLLLVLAFCAFVAEGQNSTIWFTALDKNDSFCPVLIASDVEVRDGKTKFRIESLTPKTNVPLEIIILIDTSGSQRAWIGGEINTAAYFINNILEKDRDKVAIVAFNSNTILAHDLTDDLEGAKASLLRIADDLTASKPIRSDPLPQSAPAVVAGSGGLLGEVNSYSGPDPDKSKGPKPGRTLLWRSTRRAIDVFGSLKPTDARRAILLITDGEDSEENRDLGKAIESSLRNQIPIYPIAMSDLPSMLAVRGEELLTDVAGRSGGTALLPRRRNVLYPGMTSREISLDLSPLGQRLRNYYEVVISAEPVDKKDKIRNIDVRIINDEFRKAKVKTILPQGFKLN
jgi:VWFA-related protein